jgi:hypothetical protein
MREIVNSTSKIHTNITNMEREGKYDTRLVEKLEGAVRGLGNAVDVKQTPLLWATERDRVEALLLEDVREGPP